jgi:hypothetical protein
MVRTAAQAAAGPLAEGLLSSANSQYGRAVSGLQDDAGIDVVRLGEWVIGWPAPTTTHLLPHVVDAGQSRWVTDTDGLVFRVGLSRREGRGRPAATPAPPEFKEPLWFVDAIFVEGCGSKQNFTDKRARFMAQTSAKCLEVQKRWLTRLLDDPPNGLPDHHPDARRSWEHLDADTNVWIPLRHLMVIFVLSDADCAEASRGVVCQSHEYFMSVSVAGQVNPGQASPVLDEMVRGWSSSAHLAR